jgi:Rrf2 family protein
MKIGEGVEWALHACTLLAVLPPESGLSAGRLAEFHGVPPAYMAKHLQALAQAGILASSPGRRGGYRLARSASEITVLDVVLAVEGDDHAFRCTEIRRRGPAAGPASRYRTPCLITHVMHEAEDAWRASLASRTIADVVAGLGSAVHPDAVVKTVAWLQEAMS